MPPRPRLAGLLAFLLPWSVLAAESAPGPAANYLPVFPPAKAIYVTPSGLDYPSLGKGDPGGVWGALYFTMNSLSGLAAKAALAGKNDEYLYIPRPDFPSYRIFLQRVLQLTGAQQRDGGDAMALIRHFTEKGIVKGYVLYRGERGKREPYDHIDDPAFTDNVNIATSIAPLVGGIIVDENTETKYQALGLKCLVDVRGKDNQWMFDHYSSRLARDRVFVIDPRNAMMRDFSIATDSMVIYGTDKFVEQVFRWLQPNSPVIGWNTGDEYVQTSLLSRYGLFMVPSNWSTNVPVLSTVQVGRQIGWSDLRFKSQSHASPLELPWARDTHLTSFVMSDGDNDQWFMGNFLCNPDYWASPARTTFPFGWPAPAVDLSLMCPEALEYMAQTASTNDQMLLQAGGYYYADEYGISRPGGDHVALMQGHMRQIASTVQNLDIRVICLLLKDWQSPAALQAYETIAKEVPGLVGIFTFSYNPYTEGNGKILWVTNAQGDPLPVMSLRFATWQNAPKLFNSGTPAKVASLINAMPTKGPIDENHLEWAMAHAWSFFKSVPKNTADLAAEDMPQDKADQPGTAAGVQPAKWVVDRLNSAVKVISPEELAWQARLHLKTRETLDGLARDLATKTAAPEIAAKIGSYRTWLKTATLDRDEAKAEAFQKLQQIRFGLISVPHPE